MHPLLLISVTKFLTKADAVFIWDPSLRVQGREGWVTYQEMAGKYNWWSMSWLVTSRYQSG